MYEAEISERNAIRILEVCDKTIREFNSKPHLKPKHLLNYYVNILLLRGLGLPKEDSIHQFDTIVFNDDSRIEKLNGFFTDFNAILNEYESELSEELKQEGIKRASKILKNYLKGN